MEQRTDIRTVSESGTSVLNKRLPSTVKAKAGGEGVKSSRAKEVFAANLDQIDTYNAMITKRRE